MGQGHPRGVRLDLPLTHELLTSLCGARRPTVMLALQSLARHRFLIRVSRDKWLLLSDPDPDGNRRCWKRYADVLAEPALMSYAHGRADSTDRSSLAHESRTYLR